METAPKDRRPFALPKHETAEPSHGSLAAVLDNCSIEVLKALLFALQNRQGRQADP